jgi:rhamnosyl/mannosyltransferase
MDKIRVIPIGIPPLRKNVSDDQIHAKRASIANRKVIFSLGRLVYYKGFEHLIDAAGFLDDSYLVLIGGDGPLHRRLTRRIKAKGLERRVQILGQIPANELALYYELADVFCLPSTYKTEAFGIVLLEAMSRGRPLVTTNLQDSGLSWVNQHEVTGLTVPPNDAQALADAIKTIANDRDLAQRFSVAAKKRFQEKFTADSMVESTVQLYSSLMATDSKVNRAAISIE